MWIPYEGVHADCTFVSATYRMFKLHVLKSLADESDGSRPVCVCVCVRTCVEVSHAFLCVCFFYGSWCVWASRLEKPITTGRWRTDGKRRRKGTIMCSSCWSSDQSGSTAEVTKAICRGYKSRIGTYFWILVKNEQKSLTLAIILVCNVKGSSI